MTNEHLQAYNWGGGQWTDGDSAVLEDEDNVVGRGSFGRRGERERLQLLPGLYDCVLVYASARDLPCFTPPT